MTFAIQFLFGVVLLQSCLFSTNANAEIGIEVSFDGSTKSVDIPPPISGEEGMKIDGYTRLYFHDTGIEEINWHEFLQFYWNTPILSATEDPIMHPFLQQNIFPYLADLINILPSTNNHFGDIYNASEIAQMIGEKRTANFSELLHMYRERIPSWMALYTKGQCLVDFDLDSVYILVLSPGQIFPLHGTFNFRVNSIEHESHDLISILSIHPEIFIAGNTVHSVRNNGGIFVYDPRGTASGYGFANTLIQTSQYEQLNDIGGYLHVFPSALRFTMLPIDFTRVFLISFAKIMSVHQPYRRHSIKIESDVHLKPVPTQVNEESDDKSQEESHVSDDYDANPEEKQTNDEKRNTNDEQLSISMFHLNDSFSNYDHKSDEPFFDQNIMYFSAFGTPIFYASLISHDISLAVPKININMELFAILSKCFIAHASHSPSVHKSNRGGWQSKASFFNNVNDLSFYTDNEQMNVECISNVNVLYNYLIEQISLWILSFSNSYYFDDNGLILNMQRGGTLVKIDIIHSWINVNRFADMNVAHSHPNSDLAGVVYIDIPYGTNSVNDGSLFVDDPRTQLFTNNMHLPFGQFNQPLRLNPSIGDVILFPSWLRHWTMPSYDPNPRISLAFNVKLDATTPRSAISDDAFIFFKKHI